MPSSLIEVRRPLSPEAQQHLIDAVHDSLVAAFGIPDDKRNIRVITHEPHGLSCRASLAQPENYTQVTIDCMPGRNTELKNNLYREILDRIAAQGISRDHITILLREVPGENWCVGGVLPS